MQERAMSSTNEQHEIARRFLAIRIEHKLSQQAFADALGISLRSEQNYERGARKLPSDVLFTASKVFNIDLIWILEGSGEKPRRILKPGELDQQHLTRAYKVVRAAVDESGQQVSAEQFVNMLSTLYKFYCENASGIGAEVFIEAMMSNTK
jgi:transcriptional regulator with XRE-family HTH domain